MDGTAVKEQWFPATVLGPQHLCANQDRGQKKCLKVVKVGGSPEGPMSPFPPFCPGWQQHKERQETRVAGGMTLLGVDKCPSLVLSLLKKGDFAEEGEAEG